MGLRDRDGFLDGVFHRPKPGGPLRFRSGTKLTDAGVSAVLTDFQKRLERLLRARGLLGEDAAPDERELTRFASLLGPLPQPLRPAARSAPTSSSSSPPSPASRSSARRPKRAGA